MNVQNPRAVIGDNSPPDPIDTINAEHEAAREQAEAWLDGGKVKTEAEMGVVDALRKDMREFRMALEAGQKSASAPLHDAWKAELARWNPTIKDAQRIEKGLVAAVDTFKQALADQKAEAARKALEEAERIAREAREAAQAAEATDIEAQRRAAALQAEAEHAQRAAAKAGKDTVKGMRTVTRYEITDHRALLNWIAKNDRDAITAFIEEYARLNHKSVNADSLRVWQDREAA